MRFTQPSRRCSGDTKYKDGLWGDKEIELSPCELEIPPTHLKEYPRAQAK